MKKHIQKYLKEKMTFFCNSVILSYAQEGNVITAKYKTAKNTVHTVKIRADLIH